MAAPEAAIHGMAAALRRQRVQLANDDYDSATVGYWRLRQPQFTDSDIEATASDSDDDDAINAYSDSDYDSDEYELLAPSDATTDKILAASAFYDAFMPPRGDVATDALLTICSSFPVRLTQTVCAALVRRFTTDVWFNWATKTLQSFLEVAVWLSVTLAALSLYHDALFALQVGVFAGALTSICDDVVLLLVHSAARVIRNQRGGRALLEQLGFDVPPSGGKAPTDGHELALLKTSVFGYLGVVCLRALWTHLLDVPTFALLAAAAGAAFVVTAEFCCLWLPTRRVGLTLQSRFTHIGRNWALHPLRSAVEIVCWATATLSLYASTADMSRSLQLGTLVAVCVCLASGLDELPEVDCCEDEDGDAGTSDYCVGFWTDHADGDVLLRVAGAIVAAQAAVAKRLRWCS